MRTRWEQAAIAAIMILIAMRAYNLEYFALFNSGTFKEGHVVYGAKLILEGQRPLNDFVYTHTPLSLYIISLLYSITGTKIAAARALSIAATGATAYIAYRTGAMLYDKKTGIIAALLFSASPLVFEYSRYAIADIHLMLLASAGMYMLIKGAQEQNTAYAAGSGLLFGLGFLTKETGAIFAAISMAMLLHKKQGKNAAMAAIAFAAPALIYVLTLPAGTDATGYASIYYNSQAGQSLPGKMMSLAMSVINDKTMLLLIPLILAKRGFKEKETGLLLWAASPLALLAYGYYRDYYSIIFLMPIMLLAASRYTQIPETKTWPRTAAAIAMIALLGMNLIADAENLERDKKGQLLQMKESIDKNTQQDERILISYLSIAAMADRHVPNELFEISQTRVDSKDMSSQDVIESIEKNGIRYIIKDDKIANPKMGELQEYLKTNFHTKEKVQLGGAVTEILVKNQ